MRRAACALSIVYAGFDKDWVDRPWEGFYDTLLSYEGDSMRIPLKSLEREVRHGVPKVDL